MMKIKRVSGTPMPISRWRSIGTMPCPLVFHWKQKLSIESFQMESHCFRWKLLFSVESYCFRWKAIAFGGELLLSVESYLLPVESYCFRWKAICIRWRAIASGGELLFSIESSHRALLIRLLVFLTWKQVKTRHSPVFFHPKMGTSVPKTENYFYQWTKAFPPFKINKK